MAESQRYIDHALVAIQLDHVSRALEHRPAAITLTEVRLHRHAQTRIDVIFKIVRDLLPDLFAVDYHGLVPFAKCSLVLQVPPSPGANRSRSMSRARSSRVLTDAEEIPRALAVSSMLKCCISRRTNVSRYFSPSEANASASFCRISL